jgi:dTDP-glucose 4,6-dehydratase
VNDGLDRDFEAITTSCAPLFSSLQGKRLLLTGGTGFFGKWLLGFFNYAYRTRGLDLELLVLSRNPEAFARDYPQFLSPQVRWIRGDIRTFPLDLPVDYVIHGATEASAVLNEQNPLEMLDVITQGTSHLLRVCSGKKPSKILLLSSGAVYGTQPPHFSHQPDDSQTAPDIHAASNAYGEGKRLSELLGAIHHKVTRQEVAFARCFAFIGPYLPLDTHFAVGNFMNDCLHHRPIVIQGDGTAYRSYLYAADLVSWLLTILVTGKNLTSYNVGSEESLTILEIAQAMSRTWERLTGEKIPVEVRGIPTLNAPVHRYVPSTLRARTELGLKVSHSLDQGLQKSLTWHLGLH